MPDLKQSNLFGRPGSRRWMKEVGIPLFIPPEGRVTLGRLNICSSGALLSEIQRLSSLGSNWASAALATILLYPNERGVRGLSKSKELVSRAAAEGDAYSLYVLAWAEFLSGDKSASYSHLRRAAEAGFSLAVLDLAGVLQFKDITAAVRLLKRAERMGHAAARGRIFLLWMQGRLGWFRRIPGAFGLAYRSMIITARLHQDPLSADTFAVMMRFHNPPIRRLISPE